MRLLVTSVAFFIYKGGLLMNNEEKAKELIARINMLLGTFVMVVKENVNNETCLIKDWDSYIEKMMRFFIKELVNIMIPGDQRLLAEENSEAIETTTSKKRTIGRNAPTFEEALLRAKINIMPLDDEIKRILIMPKLWKIYLKHLDENEKNNK